MVICMFFVYLICDFFDLLLLLKSFFHNYNWRTKEIKHILFTENPQASEVSAENRCWTGLAWNFEDWFARWKTRWQLEGGKQRGVNSQLSIKFLEGLLAALSARNEEYRNFPGGNIPREWRGCVHCASPINFEAYSNKARNGEDFARFEEKSGQSQRFSSEIAGHRQRKFVRGHETYGDWCPQSCEERSNERNFDTADQSRVVSPMGARKVRYFFTLRNLCPDLTSDHEVKGAFTSFLGELREWIGT